MIGMWLLVTNVTIADKSQSSAIYNKYSQNPGSIANLVNTTNGSYRFDNGKFATLWTLIGFKEMTI